ncbi:hypothetical protein SPAR_18418, partial [Streptomyces sparsogenes DSM 40356]
MVRKPSSTSRAPWRSGTQRSRSWRSAVAARSSSAGSPECSYSRRKSSAGPVAPCSSPARSPVSRRPRGVPARPAADSPVECVREQPRRLVGPLAQPGLAGRAGEVVERQAEAGESAVQVGAEPLPLLVEDPGDELHRAVGVPEPLQDVRHAREPVVEAERGAA